MTNETTCEKCGHESEGSQCENCLKFKMTNSPRQFWLANVPPQESVFDFFETQVSRIYSGDMDFKNAMHVIEFSAVQKLQSQLDEANKKLHDVFYSSIETTKIQGEQIGKLEYELGMARAEVERLIEVGSRFSHKSVKLQSNNNNLEMTCTMREREIEKLIKLAQDLRAAFQSSCDSHGAKRHDEELLAEADEILGTEHEIQVHKDKDKTYED